MKREHGKQFKLLRLESQTGKCSELNDIGNGDMTINGTNSVKRFVYALSRFMSESLEYFSRLASHAMIIRMVFFAAFGFGLLYVLLRLLSPTPLACSDIS